VFSSVKCRCVIFAAVLAWNSVCLAGEESDRLRVIAESSLANRKAFPFINCRFVVVYAKCDNDKDPLEGGNLREGQEADGVWIVRNDQVRHEIIVDPTEERAYLDEAYARAAAKAGPDVKKLHVSVGRRLTSRKILWDGARGMSYSPIIGGGGMFPPDRPGPGITMTPFDLAGMMGPDERLHPGYVLEKRDESGAITWRFVGRETVRGRDLLVVSCDDNSYGDNAHSKYWFDPEWGFLPVQKTYHYDDPKHIRGKAVVTDVREFSGGRWFPTRSVQILSPGPAEPDGELEVFELRVKELDVDTPPSDEMLALEIPKGARLHNSVDALSQSTLQEGQRISVADLGGVKEEMSTRVEERRIQHQQEAAQPLVESESGGNRFLFMAVGASLLILAVAAVIIVTSRRFSR
jgi:hypothetical protein